MNDKLREKSKSFAAHHPIMSDAGLRQLKGEKIADVLQEINISKHGLSILDIGCSNGITLMVVANRLNPDIAMGIDMDIDSLPEPGEQKYFTIMDGEHLGFSNEYFDIVLCNHTYEHVPNSDKLFSEIHRVLKHNGVVYFSAMNRLWPIEPHYKIPFVHWIPKWMSYPVMRLFGNKHQYIETPKTLPGLKKLVRNFFIQDFTVKIIKDPEKYHATDLITSPAKSSFYSRLARLLYPLLPGYIWILRKKTTSKG
ncbi:MAG: class I SAM-dependent methyltransferase [Pseudomonadota bacterium]